MRRLDARLQSLCKGAEKRAASSLRWSVLNRVSDNAIMNAGYVGAIAIPGFAAFILEMGAKISNDIQIGPALLVAYLASLCLATGKLLFFIGCPKIIAYYNNFTRYASELDDLIRALNSLSEWETAAVVQNKRDEVLGKLRDKGATDEQVKVFADLMADAQRRIKEADARKPIENLVLNYEARWREAERKWPAVRYTVGVLYALSAVMAAYLFFWVGVLLVSAAGASGQPA